MRKWIAEYWLTVLSAAVPSAVVAIAGWLVWASFDPCWSARLASVPAVTGALVGPLLGLLAILFGALLNADLNRRRDDRIKEVEARALAGALYAEVHNILLQCREFVLSYKEALNGFESLPPDSQISSEAVDIWPIVETPVFRANCGRLGLLGTELATGVCVTVESVMKWRRYASRPRTWTPARFTKMMKEHIETMESDIPNWHGTANILGAFERGGIALANLALDAEMVARTARAEQKKAKKAKEQPKTSEPGGGHPA